MKKIISAIIVSMLIIGSLLPVSSLPVFADSANKDSFTADFTTTDGWTGDTAYINASKGFGSGKGFDETTTATITTADSFDFGDTFNASFEMTTDYSNHNEINEWEDYYLIIGKFKIAICDFQTRIKVYYDGADIGGMSLCSNMAYGSPITRHYNVHIEPGNIKITSERVTYTSTFANFDAVNNASVSLKKNETWQIYSAYINNLVIAKENNSFVADFTTTDNWTGLTEYINTANNNFSTNKEWDNQTGLLTTAKSYSFGSIADAGFTIFTGYANLSYYNNNGLVSPGFDYSLSIGKFQICILDYQTRIVVKYNGTNITGTSVCSDYSYKTDLTRSYDVHIEPGFITVNSANVSYTSDFADFDSLDNVKISIGVHETWQIAAFKISNVFVNTGASKCETGDVNTDGKIDATDLADLRALILGNSDENGKSYDVNSDGAVNILDLVCLKKILVALEESNLSEPFSADFTTTDGWSGDTDIINTTKAFFGTNTGWDNKAGTITANKKFNLGSSFTADFSLYTDWANGSPTSDRFVVNIGDFKAEVSAFQNKIALYYKGEELAKAAKEGYTYGWAKSYNYSLYVAPGAISFVQYTSDGQSVLSVSSDLSDYDKLTNVSVSLSNLETWEVHYGYFTALNIEAVKPNPCSLTDSFDNADNWDGDVSYVNPQRGFGEVAMWADSTKTVTSKSNYNFGTTFDASFKLNTVWSNDYTINTGEEFLISIGDFKIAVCNFQTKVKVYYKGTDIGGICSCPNANYESPRTCSYSVHIEPGNITVTSEKLEYTSDFAAFVPQNNVKVTLKKNTTWQINAVFIDDFSVSTPNANTNKTVSIDSGITNGTVMLMSSEAKPGEKVTVYVQPKPNYQLKLGSLVYTYTENDIQKSVTVTETENANTYKFVMPDANATVSALFEKAGTLDVVILSTALNNENPANATGITVKAVVNRTSGITGCGVDYNLGGEDISAVATSTKTLANGSTEFTTEIAVENWYDEISIKPYVVINSTKSCGTAQTVSMNEIAGFNGEDSVTASFVDAVNEKKNNQV